MNKKMKWLGIFALAASLLLTACGAQPADPTPTAAPEATAAAEPTATPEATAAEPTEEPTAEPVSQPVEKSTGIVNMAEEGKTHYAAQLGRYAAALSERRDGTLKTA